MPVIDKVDEIRESGGRWYKISGKWHMSITTLLDKCYPKGYALMQWMKNQPDAETADRLKNEAADRGTRVHEAIEKLIKNRKISLVSVDKEPIYSRDEYRMIQGFINWYREYRPEIIKTEFYCYDDTLKIAGRGDCLCTINGQLHYVDWKTSSGVYNNHFIQAAFYGLCADAQPSILHLKSTTKKGFQFHEECPDDCVRALSALTIIRRLEDGRTEPDEIEVIPNELQLEE